MNVLIALPIIRFKEKYHIGVDQVIRGPHQLKVRIRLRLWKPNVWMEGPDGYYMVKGHRMPRVGVRWSWVPLEDVVWLETMEYEEYKSLREEENRNGTGGSNKG